MTATDVVPAFLAICPSIGPSWQAHLDFWGDEPYRGDFNDAAVIAHHLVDSFERAELSEFPATFALLERCLTEGDEQAREVAIIGVIETIQAIASHRPFEPGVFYQWLGPESRSAWDDLVTCWQRIGEAKAAGLLEPLAGQPAPAVDPGLIQDPALRRIIEQSYRR